MGPWHFARARRQQYPGIPRTIHLPKRILQGKKLASERVGTPPPLSMRFILPFLLVLPYFVSCEIVRPFGPVRQGFVDMPDDARDGPWRYTCNDGKVFIRQQETYRICDNNGGIAKRELIYRPVGR